MIVASDRLLFKGLPHEGVEVSAWKEHRFTAAPVAGNATPSGAPDAGPTTTGAIVGPGYWRLELPSAENYWLCLVIDGVNQWRYWPGPVVQEQILAGDVQFGSGATPAAGIQVSVNFPKPKSAPPLVIPVPANPKTGALGVYPANVTTTGFAIATAQPPAPNQPIGAYDVHFLVFGE